VKKSISLLVSVFIVFLAAFAGCAEKSPTEPCKDCSYTPNTITETWTISETPTITNTWTVTVTRTSTITPTVTNTPRVPEIDVVIRKYVNISISSARFIIRDDQSTPIVNATVTLNGISVPHVTASPGPGYYDSLPSLPFNTNITMTVKVDNQTYSEVRLMMGSATFTSASSQVSWLYTGMSAYVQVRFDADNTFAHSSVVGISNPYTIPITVGPEHYINFMYDSVTASGAFAGALSGSSIEIHDLERINP
jgi:hypothetical protein